MCFHCANAVLYQLSYKNTARVQDTCLSKHYYKVLCVEISLMPKKLLVVVYKDDTLYLFLIHYDIRQAHKDTHIIVFKTLFSLCLCLFSVFYCRVLLYYELITVLLQSREPSHSHCSVFCSLTQQETSGFLLNQSKCDISNVKGIVHPNI